MSSPALHVSRFRVLLQERATSRLHYWSDYQHRLSRRAALPRWSVRAQRSPPVTASLGSSQVGKVATESGWASPVLALVRRSG
jgi:hypothetical protein